MNRDEIAAAVIVWITRDRAAEGLPEVTLEADTALLEQGIFDSMKLLELVAWIEKAHGVVIGVEHLTPTVFATPGTIADHIVETGGGTEAGS